MGLVALDYKVDYFWAVFGAVNACYLIPALNSQESVGACSASESRIEVTLLMRAFNQGLDVTDPGEVALVHKSDHSNMRI